MNSVTLFFPLGILGSVVSFFAEHLCNFYLISEQILSIQIKESHLVLIGMELPMQLVHITTDVVSSILNQAEVYNIM